jgi:hypothetical protein
MKDVITLAAGAGNLLRGTVLSLNTTTKKWHQLNPAGSTGTNVARAILVNAVDATYREMKAIGGFDAKYRYVDLIWPTGITRHQIDTALLELQDRGIIVDEGFSTENTTTTTTTSSSSTTTSSSTSTTAAC